MIAVARIELYFACPSSVQPWAVHTSLSILHSPRIPLFPRTVDRTVESLFDEFEICGSGHVVGFARHARTRNKVDSATGHLYSASSNWAQTFFRQSPPIRTDHYSVRTTESQILFQYSLLGKAFKKGVINTTIKTAISIILTICTLRDAESLMTCIISVAGGAHLSVCLLRFLLLVKLLWNISM